MKEESRWLLLYVKKEKKNLKINKNDILINCSIK